MTRDQIVSALASIRPKAEYALRGETYADLEWLDPVQAKPTEVELNTAIATVSTPTPADVDVERDRRINLGFVFQTVAYQSRLDKGDFENISGMGALAINALRDGTGTAGNLRWFDPNNDFKWIATDNSETPMDALTVVAFGKAAAAHKSGHVFAAAQIKKLSPIPADYATNAAYWPAT